MVPDLADKLPPSCGLVSAEISENSELITISLPPLAVKSIPMPTPGTSLLNVNPDSVLLTVTKGVDPVDGSFCPT